MMPYERLAAWKQSHRLALMVYRLTAHWPKQELYGLVSQARRAACSVPMNIAEGSAKRGSREFRRYLDIALGSLSEVAYCLHLARDLEYLTEEQWQEIDTLRGHAGLLTWRLYDSVAKNARTSLPT
jgi:four helix bundle protein